MVRTAPLGLNEAIVGDKELIGLTVGEKEFMEGVKLVLLVLGLNGVKAIVGEKGLEDVVLTDGANELVLLALGLNEAMIGAKELNPGDPKDGVIALVVKLDCIF